MVGTVTEKQSCDVVNTLVDSDRERRVRSLLGTEINFIPNPEFAAEQNRSSNSAEFGVATDSARVQSDLPAHLRRLCETALLTHQQEAALFREMNLLKYQANALRSRLDPNTATEADVSEIESRLEQARAIRDHIVQANTRLVISIVKKFVTPQQSFDEMLSDGILTLMNAVEKFDFDRGFRFSTYAYRSIARSVYRSMNANKAEARFASHAEEWVLEQENQSVSQTTEQMWDRLRDVAAGMLESLDRRERFIIRCRYALGAHRKVKTCQCLADKLGVSKERVRQLEHRAVGKLRKMAAGLERDELFGAAMV